MNLTSRNQDPIHASLALSSLLSVWYKPNSLNNKSIYNTLVLEFYICAKPRLTHWYPCPKKSANTFAQGCMHFVNIAWTLISPTPVSVSKEPCAACSSDTCMNTSVAVYAAIHTGHVSRNLLNNNINSGFSRGFDTSSNIVRGSSRSNRLSGQP